MTPALKAEHIAAILDRAAHGQATADEIALALRWVEEVKAALMEQRQEDVMDERCGNCRFWELSGYAIANGMESGVGGYHCGGDYSSCRRRAPIFDAKTAGSTSYFAGQGTTFPYTAKTAWCGEWEPRGGQESAAKITPRDVCDALKEGSERTRCYLDASEDDCVVIDGLLDTSVVAKWINMRIEKAVADPTPTSPLP